MEIKKVLLYGRKTKKADIPFLNELLDSLSQHKIEPFIYLPYWEELQQQKFSPEILKIDSTEELEEEGIDLLISLGGDGTILRATTLIKDLHIPIIGINLGRLGFLANADKNKISQVIEDITAGKFKIEERSMIAISSNHLLFPEATFALNDFTIHKRDNSSMILIHCYINGELLNSYWADGIIVSTPTGSTGYALSCGGPIITPSCGNFVIAPVAPHNLTARPVVVSDDSIIEFKVEGRSEYFLCTLDSRYEKITTEHIIELRKCQFPTRLIQLEEHSFLQTIHKKLMWGIDHRNT